MAGAITSINRSLGHNSFAVLDELCQQRTSQEVRLQRLQTQMMSSAYETQRTVSQRDAFAIPIIQIIS